MTHAAPIARLALAYGAGVAVGLAGAPVWAAPLLVLVGWAAPVFASRRPVARLLLPVAVGAFAGATASPQGCEAPADGGPARVPGYFLATPGAGSAPLRRADGCGTVTVVVPDDVAPSPRAGLPVVVEGRWRPGARRAWLQASAVRAWRPPPGVGDGVARGVARWRDGLVARLPRLYGEHAPLVAALVFARREGMNREVRDAFAVTGIAHLLAISGFHVGVIAGLALALLRAFGVSRRRSALGAAVAGWAYVAFIGFPDAACRAALILGLAAVSRLSGRPPTRWAALAAAALVLLTLDPSRLASAGFQLSFAGAAGLVAWSRGLEGHMRRRTRGRPPRALLSASAAGVSATLATLPVVAWHFERVSAVGIPMTLLASPVVSLALPGALLSIVLDFFAPGPAAFLAGGVGGLLDLLVVGTTRVASAPGVSLWVTRATVVAGLSGVAVATWVARRPRVGGRARRRLVAAYVAAAVVAWPVAVGLEGRGTLELFAVDVGQGDAVAVRTPGGRWLLVDAGPPGDGGPGGHPVVRALRSRGVGRLERLILTHPDADHFGGAEAVLESFEVGGVLDPLVAAPKRTYADLLRTARDRGVPWRAARAGDGWELDGVSFRVLHPPRDAVVDPGEVNAASVVLLVRWRDFEALLTGDAYVEVEREVAGVVGDIDMLKVGHHGSETSTDADFLATVRPEIAVVSVGRGNRYGHPAGRVLARLEAVGARVLRTDRQGGVRVIVGRDGRIQVRTER